MEERTTIVRPGQFGQVVPADARRGVFDAHNEQLIGQQVPIAAVFAGDSITESWALDAFFRSESGLIVNRGIGGDSTPYLRGRFAADVVQLMPRLLVLMIGVNNTWDLDNSADASLLRTPPEIEEEIVADIDEMVQAAGVEGITVALCSILPTDIWALAGSVVRNEVIARTNDRLRDLAARRQALYVDYHAHLAGPDGLTLRPGLADDGLHPHLLGYREMARVLLDTLAGAGIDILEARE